jgi:beta-galactosidase
MLAALAYGLRGFNLYMAVERDRWIGAPIDPHGRERPFALFWRKLVSALEKVEMAKLRRRVPVRILVPRNERRLARVMHAFGPISGAFFSVAGRGARESCREDDLGLGYPPPVEADTFQRMVESALEGRGVPFACIGGEDRDVSLEGARWIVCVASGGLSPVLFERLVDAANLGAAVTLGPRAPTLGGARRPLTSPLDLGRLAPRGPGIATLCASDPASVEGLVADAIARLELPTFGCDPDGVYATVHEDDAGQPRVMFIVNPGAEDCPARVTAPPGVTAAVDLLKDQRYEVQSSTLELRVKPRTVKMLALERG